jgi:long-chain acyl-CoA synthetase
VARFGVTRVFASPWQVRRLLQSPSPALPLPPLRSLNVAGAMITPTEIEAARAALTPNLLIDYGCSEVGPLAMVQPGAVVPRPGCVGLLLPGVQSRVSGAQGEMLAPGEPGELGFRAAWMCSGYVDNPQATAEHFRYGWFYPGDTGSVDAQGNVHLLGRSGDLINYGGKKIWPDDIEAVLKQHPDVHDAALVGLPDPQAGEVPAAFVVLRTAAAGALSARLEETQLRAFCAARIDATRLPRYFFLATQIPRNEAGKIMRQTLIEAHARSVAAAGV